MCLIGSFQITAFVQELGACEILCVPFKSRVFPTVLWHFPMHALLAFNGRCFGVSCSQVRTHGLGSSVWVLDHLFLIENSAVVIIFPFMSDIYLPRVCVYQHMSIISLCLSHCVSFFICIVVETSASFQVVLIGNCSVNTCHFCVPMGGCKLRVFLLHHFHHQHRGLLDGCSTPFFLNVDISQHSYHLYSILSSKLSLIILISMVGSLLLYSRELGEETCGTKLKI